MSKGGFLQWENGVSRSKLISQVNVARFIKGNTKRFWKTNHDDPDFKSAAFLKLIIERKVSKNIFLSSKSAPRGI